MLGFFVITLDATIVNVALPSIRQELGGGISGLQWVVDGYALMFAAFLLSAGSLSDRVGARQSHAVGLVLFMAASLACALATNLSMLVAARIAQGIGAAVIMPSTMALIRHAYPASAARARAVGLWALGGAVAAAAGPLLGGLLSMASWRLIFYINLPVGLLTVLLLLRSPRTTAQQRPFDVAGQLTAVAAMGGLTYGAIEVGSAGLEGRVLAAFTIALVATVAFALTQARGRHPMLPLRLFSSSTVSGAVVIGFAFMVGFYGTPFLYSLYFQQVRGLSALQAGLTFLPMMVLSACLTPFSARIAGRLGPRTPIAAGLACLVLGALALALVPASAPVWVISVLLVPMGLSGPLVMPATTATLLDQVEASLAGTASGVFNTSRQLGGALAVAVFGALLAASAGFQTGLRISLALTAAVAALALLCLPLIRVTSRSSART
ncbi:MFS transporter [Quadrisphaera sp. KR29]|uniref:MFS transporter n=1 Tax=Quadrisphaera sp. KR29 TaxID=3461391 RepID=UPI004043C830